MPTPRFPRFRAEYKPQKKNPDAPRPCPFCGRLPETAYHQASHTTRSGWEIKCVSRLCRVIPCTDLCKTEELARAWWDGDRSKRKD